MAQLQCPHCGRQHNIPERLYGKRVKCPCGIPLDVPDFSAYSDVFGDAGDESGRPCPICQGPLPPAANVCPHCHTNLETGKREQNPFASPGTQGKKVSGKWDQRRINTVSWALWLMFIGELTSAISVLVIIGIVVIAILVSPTLALIVSPLLIFPIVAIPISRLLVLVTRFMCLAAPMEQGAFLLALSSLAADTLAVSTFIYSYDQLANGDFTPQMLNELADLEMFASITIVIGEVLFLLFLKSVCRIAKRKDLAEEAQTIVNVEVFAVVVNLIFEVVQSDHWLVAMLQILWAGGLLIVMLFLTYKYFQLLSGASTSLAVLKRE